LAVTRRLFGVRHGGIVPGNGYRAIAALLGLAKSAKACIATGTEREQEMAKPDNPVLMGVIGAPHGVRGELRVKPYTGDPLALGDYGTLYDTQGRAFDVIDIRPAEELSSSSRSNR
jgi:hypothetical protein